MKTKRMDHLALPLRSWIWMGLSLALAAAAWTCAEKWTLPSEPSSRLRPRLPSLGVIDSFGSKSWVGAEPAPGMDEAEYVDLGWEKRQKNATLDAADALVAQARALEWATKQSARVLSNQAAGDGARELVVLTMGPEGPLRCQLRYEWMGKRQSMILARQECAPKVQEGNARR